MALIKGIQVKLFKKVLDSYDQFNAPVFNEVEVIVDNVLVEPLSSEEIINEMSLYGRKADYRLHIPKGDTNDWENVKVEFYGETFQTYGLPIQYIEGLTPLEWDKKVKCGRIE